MMLLESFKNSPILPAAPCKSILVNECLPAIYWIFNVYNNRTLSNEGYHQSVSALNLANHLHFSICWSGIENLLKLQNTLINSSEGSVGSARMIYFRTFLLLLSCHNGLYNMQAKYKNCDNFVFRSRQTCSNAYLETQKSIYLAIIFHYQSAEC